MDMNTTQLRTESDQPCPTAPQRALSTAPHRHRPQPKLAACLPPSPCRWQHGQCMQPDRSQATTSPHASTSPSATLRAASITLAASSTAMRMPQDTCRRAAVSGAALPTPGNAPRSLLVTGRGPQTPLRISIRVRVGPHLAPGLHLRLAHRLLLLDRRLDRLARHDDRLRGARAARPRAGRRRRRAGRRCRQVGPRRQVRRRRRRARQQPPPAAQGLVSPEDSPMGDERRRARRGRGRARGRWRRRVRCGRGRARRGRGRTRGYRGRVRRGRS